MQGLKNEASESQITETALVLNNTNTDLVDFDQKVKSMMTTSENKIGKQQTHAKICTVCGKEGQMTNIMNHIEANHMTNISIPCNVCEKTFQTRAALLQHNRKNHSQH